MLRVDEETKEFLLDTLREIRDTKYKGDFARGYEAGAAFVMVLLGIEEAASPNRRNL